jgi:1,4-alpha-glucan branching enzyme
LTRLRKWLTAPRTVRLSPLGALAAAALVAALFAGPVEVRLRGATPSEVTAGTAVQFVLIDPDASSVWLVGDFNDWRRDATRLARTGPSGVWSVDVPLAPGRHAYAFIVDDVWAPDALAPKAPDSEFGQATSVVVVPGGHES